VVALLLWLLCLIPATANAADAIQVAGTDGAVQSWTVARMKDALAGDAKTIEYTGRGQKHTANAVPLVALLKAAGVPVALKMDPNADPKLKNHNLRLAVVVEAGDGYTAAFSLGELMPEIGNKEVWLVLDEDGKPLSQRDGLVKLVLPAEKMPARWVRDVVSISVVDPTAAKRPTTQRAGS